VIAAVFIYKHKNKSYVQFIDEEGEPDLDEETEKNLKRSAFEEL